MSIERDPANGVSPAKRVATAKHDAPQQPSPLVSVRGVRVHFPGDTGTVRAVDNVDLDIE